MMPMHRTITHVSFFLISCQCLALWAAETSQVLISEWETRTAERTGGNDQNHFLETMAEEFALTKDSNELRWDLAINLPPSLTVAFLMSCNSAVPLSVDFTVLRQSGRSGIFQSDSGRWKGVDYKHF